MALATRTEREERRDLLYRRRDEIRRSDPRAALAPLASETYYQNEVELVALLTPAELVDWFDGAAPPLMKLAEDLGEEGRRHFALLTLFTLQALSLGRVGVSVGPESAATIRAPREDVLVERTSGEAAGRLEGPEPAAPFTPPPAPVEEPVGPLEPPFDAVGLSVLKRGFITIEKAAQAITENLGTKRGIPGYQDDVLNRARLLDFVKALDAGRIDGWEVHRENKRVKAVEKGGSR